MPISRRRKKTSSSQAAPAARPKRTTPAPSPPWYGGLILAMFAIGIIWLLVYYLSNGGVLGMQDLSGWNLAIGFGFVVVGLGLATQWR